MTNTPRHSCLQHVLDTLPEQFQGPGGAVGIVKDGEVLTRQTWGYVNLDEGRPFTAARRVPICSISKQFTCGVLLDVVGDTALLDDRLSDVLPHFESRLPTVADLCNMQSGLRDYWALTVLQGAHPEGVFRREDAGPLLARMRTTHFEPGSSYSYSNGNFRILSDLIEEYADQPLGDLYRDRIFDPANMDSALLSPDTSVRVDGTVGYEGNQRTGFFPAENRIYWSGDAGINASLNDMLAWEQHIDATREDPDSLYCRLSRPQTFRNGAAAPYGYGLAHGKVNGFAVTGHSGALRGFRLQRLHMAAHRLSVVVLFNHEADAHDAATRLMRAALGDVTEPEASNHVIDPTWAGHYLVEDSDHLLAVETNGQQLEARYGTRAERLRLTAAGIAQSSAMTLALDGDDLTLTRPGENLATRATRVPDGVSEDLAGCYRSRELGAVLRIDRTGPALYGCFEGLLGTGPMHSIRAVGRDVFALSCQRSMDAPAPGDWTIRIRRDAAGNNIGLVVGCWLARKITYERV